MSELQASDIIRLLEEPDVDRWPSKERISTEARPVEITAALQAAAAPLTRHLLCDILGDRCVVEAVPTLIACLRDPDPGVRNAAAEALGKIGDSRAGPALLERFVAEPDLGMRRQLAASVGSVGYRPAIAALIQALQDPDEGLNATAAWGLGILGAPEAADALRQALARATSPSTATRVAQAWTAVETVPRALRWPSMQVVISTLCSELEDPAVAAAAAWGLSVHCSQPAGEPYRAEARQALQRALDRNTKYAAFEQELRGLAGRFVEGSGADNAEDRQGFLDYVLERVTDAEYPCWVLARLREALAALQA